MKNYDVSMKAMVIACTQKDNEKLLLEVAVLNVTMDNDSDSQCNFGVPPIVNMEVYCGNLTAKQYIIMLQKGTVAVFGISLGEEILVEEVACVIPHPAKEIGAFLDAVKTGKYTQATRIR